MKNIKGTVVELYRFLFKQEINIKIDNTDQIVFKKSRKLIVPDYQREIRWTSDTILTLIDDINRGDKFLGNVILSKAARSANYEIIDGQQRLISLMLILDYIKFNYGDAIGDIDETIQIELKSFTKYNEFRKNGYSLNNLSDRKKEEIISSDAFNQIPRFEKLYAAIRGSEYMSSLERARKIWDNLRQCSLNVIASEGEDAKLATVYYVDVNLKGIKLDCEDIFKGYLFASNSSQTTKNRWVDLKKKWMDFNEISTGDKEKTVYPLMKIIYHSIYCLLLSQPEYKGIEINDDFMLTKPINIGGDEFHKGDHILRVINHNTKIDNTLVKTIDFVAFLSEICKVCGGKSQEHKKMFSPADDSRIEAIVNFIQKIILDKDMVVPKSIIAKYYFSTLLKEKKTKNDIYKIYGLYFFINLFVLFQDKRNLDPIKRALKEEDYYISIMKETSKMFSSNALTSGKRNAIFKATNNLDDINLQFRCKSLATLYNYFYFQNGSVIFKDRKDIPITRYLSDSNEYSVEHFVISKSDKVLYDLENGGTDEYPLPEELMKLNKYIFNFIFIPNSINEEYLKNYSIIKKVDILEKHLDEVKCDFSKMVFECAKKSFKGDILFKQLGVNELNELDRYWQADFRKQYDNYVKAMIENLIIKINKSE